MSKNLSLKIIAMATLVGFFLLSVPGLSSAPKKTTKFDFRILIKKPATWISSFMSFLNPVFDSENPEPSKSNSSNVTIPITKPTGGLAAPRPSTGD